MSKEEKPNCEINGLFLGRGMCGYILVGGNKCGLNGTCTHQVKPNQSQDEILKGGEK